MASKCMQYNFDKAASKARPQTLVNAYFYLHPHENDHRLCSVFTRPHENARKPIKRGHTPNAHALSI